MNGGEAKSHVKKGTGRIEEMGRKLRAAVGGDMERNSVLGEDVRNEGVCNVGHRYSVQG